MLITLFGVSLVAKQHDWSAPSGPSMTYRSIRPFVAQGEKFDATHTSDILRRLEQQLTRSGATVVLTPETASLVFFNELPVGFIQSLRSFALRTQSHVLLGIPAVSGSGTAHNALVHLSHAGESSFSPVYKSRLMPFGKYTPEGGAWLSRRWQSR